MCYTKETAIQNAINEAEVKNSQGKLISSNDESFDWEDPKNFENGDPETIYSIASLYGQEFDNTDVIESTLIALYPKF